jgi:hypothetical protein
MIASRINHLINQSIINKSINQCALFKWFSYNSIADVCFCNENLNIYLLHTSLIISPWKATVRCRPKMARGASVFWMYPVNHISHLHDDNSASQVIWMYPVKHISHLFISVNHLSCSSSAPCVCPGKHISHFYDHDSTSQMIWMYPVKHISHLLISDNHLSCSS